MNKVPANIKLRQAQELWHRNNDKITRLEQKQNQIEKELAESLEISVELENKFGDIVKTWGFSK